MTARRKEVRARTREERLVVLRVGYQKIQFDVAKDIDERIL